LIVCDIDEVVLEFISPFQAYLIHNGHELRARLSGSPEMWFAAPTAAKHPARR
jgi:predicted secreted acid phosphatase